MKRRELFKLFYIILSILTMSLLIGNLLMAPMIVYYKVLVRFFGWLFLLLIIVLITGKFYANFRHIRATAKDALDTSLIIKQTLTATIGQIYGRIVRFSISLSFLFLVGLFTFLVIWLNSKLVVISSN